MINEDIIKNILANPNANNVICREFDLKPSSIATLCCALANTIDGFIIIGVVRDESGYTVNGVSKRFNYQNIVNAAIKLLDSIVKIETRTMEFDGKSIIVISIAKSDKKIALEEKYYILENYQIVKVKGDYFMDKTKVFIVHGHDDAAKLEVARFIEKLGFEAIILHEKVSKGKTIIEKIEEYSNVGFAVVLYTPCDEGKSKNETALKNRARQNVVFEHGYLIGKIGRQNVSALVKDEIEKPNDISGVVYIEMDSFGAWKNTLANEMKESGYIIDKNKM